MTEDLSILTRKGTPPDHNLIYGSHADQVADIRYGSDGARRPLVMLIHGGFWKPEYDRQHTEAMSSALAAEGWTVVTPEYRRIPGNPDASLEDIASAIEMLPHQVARHNGKIILAGHSAGGHLVLWAAVKCATPALAGVLALAPAADLRMAYDLKLGDGAVLKFLGKNPAERPDADPMQLPAPAVPVTVLQGSLDKVVPPVVPEAYCKAFPKTQLVLLPDAGHFAVIDPQSNAWPAMLSALRDLSGV
ncbi:alpha/beta hydrolase [Undibacterium sp. Tian12W]|uniref:alpha/beta hydrolase n=1 Tax=Undibacterium sp. Tian12W TaxID=3413054 RepID=UPI003BF423D4